MWSGHLLNEFWHIVDYYVSFQINFFPRSASTWPMWKTEVCCHDQAVPLGTLAPSECLRNIMIVVSYIGSVNSKYVTEVD